MDIQDTSDSQDIQVFKMLKIPVAPVILVTNVTCSTNETDIESIRILPQSFRACFEIVKAGPFFQTIFRCGTKQPFSERN